MITLQCTENLIRIIQSVVPRLADGPIHLAGLTMDMTMMLSFFNQLNRESNKEELEK